jgi:spore coat polysaccharide biosynthesis predicted glycosyltransferase SpsG
MDPRFKVFPFGSVLDSIINQSNVVITSASTSSFEILARGIPTGIIRLVGNQDNNFRALHEAELVSLIGSRSDDGVWDFSLPGLERLMLDAVYRQTLRERNLKVFDLEGASRILEKISELYKESQ